MIINSFGVVLMLYSGAGISAISSVPYAFSEVFPRISLGTWTYIFQELLVLSLMILRKRFVPSYLFSFVVGFAFSELLDVHELWISILPTALPCRVLYFVLSYLILSFGIGTILAAFTMGKTVGLIGDWMDRHIRFVTVNVSQFRLPK